MLLLCAGALALASFPRASAQPTAVAQPPNIVIFLADDMGYSDLGCYGSEIQTANLDRLAAEGLRFTQFYNTTRCWPTRAAILTGYYPQQIRRDTVPGVKSGGAGTRPEWARLLPQMLKPLGYRSYHSGKWHVDGMPMANGFDRSYYLEDCGRNFNPRSHYLDDQKLPAVERGSGYYSTVAIADRAVEFLKQHAEQHAGQPFFGYFCFVVPHFPLQALPEDIAKYRKRYLEGWDTVRQERWERMKKLGLIHHGLPPLEREVGPPYDFPKAIAQLGPGETNGPVPWAELNATQREFQAVKMAIHAAMVDRMDHEIGRVVDQLRQMNAFENTLILFLSDNGASAEMMVRDDGHDPSASPGSAATHLCLGPGWSSTANTPLRRHKTWVEEGGISTSMIMHWPKGIKARGELRDTPGHVIDFVPTFLELAGGKHPAQWNGQPLEPLPGRSLVPVLTRDTELHRDQLWWAHEGNRAIRVGDWKLVADKNTAWELYDLKTDRGEMHNLAAQYADKVSELSGRWERQWEACRQLASKDLPTEPPAKKGGKKAKAK
jgi:arylsulfatase A-like enzyme